ncbi:hypothetical protein ABZ479_39620 [Streptomyces sp. NPDC005722]
MDIEQVMTYLVDHRAPGLPPGYLSEQLMSLSWIVEDEGKGIFDVARRWLVSDDPFRAAVVMGLTETVLVDTLDELVDAAARITRCFPSMALDVEAWVVRSRSSVEGVARSLPGGDGAPA